MSYYVVHNSTNELIYISDFEPPNDEYNGQGHHVFESELSVDEIQSEYDWSAQSLSFVRKSTLFLSKLQFLKKFTPQEYASIKAATTENAVLDYYWQMFMSAEKIDLTDRDTIDGIKMIENLNIISQGRAGEILNG